MKPQHFVSLAVWIFLGGLLTPAALGQFQWQTLKSFDFDLHPGEGLHPKGIIEGSDGKLYGTTQHGGLTNENESGGMGTVFRLNKDGSGFAVLHSFSGVGGEGLQPEVAVVEGSDGKLYGTTHWGGTIFKLNKDGSGYSTLHSFTGTNGDGSFPAAALIQGSDGALYGITMHGGINDEGTIFKLNKDGSGFAVRHSYSVTGRGGFRPAAALLEGSDGALYGTTLSGGTNESGTVFRLNKDGGGYSVLHSFSGTNGDGSNPAAALIEGSDGALYGTTRNGGTNFGRGTVFKLDKDGNGYAVLQQLSVHSDDGEAGPWLLEGADGALYGTTSGAGPVEPGAIFKLNKDSSSYTHLCPGYFSGALVQGQRRGALWGAANSQRRHLRVTSPASDAAAHRFWQRGPVRFSSMPGSTHRLQRAGMVDGNWLTLTNLIVPTNGVAELTDSAPPQLTAFYRTVAP